MDPCGYSTKAGQNKVLCGCVVVWLCMFAGMLKDGATFTMVMETKRRRS